MASISSNIRTSHLHVSKCTLMGFWCLDAAS